MSRENERVRATRRYGTEGLELAAGIYAWLSSNCMKRDSDRERGRGERERERIVLEKDAEARRAEKLEGERNR